MSRAAAGRPALLVLAAAVRLPATAAPAPEPFDLRESTEQTDVLDTFYGQPGRR